MGTDGSGGHSAIKNMKNKFQAVDENEMNTNRTPKKAVAFTLNGAIEPSSEKKIPPLSSTKTVVQKMYYGIEGENSSDRR